MICDILTLFPGMILPVLNESILKRAQEKGLLIVRVINIRDFATDKHHKVDDYPYGGGPGMVLKAEPVIRAVEYARGEKDVRIILLSPQGKRYDQNMAYELSREERKIIFICGHYEGIDERVKIYLHPEEISIGDYILTGGELAALVIIDSATRLIPGVLGDMDSTKEESFNLFLDYPHYTRPQKLRGMKVPEILLSGHHEKIRIWRRKQAILNTIRKRPDLLQEDRLSDEDKRLLEEVQREMNKEGGHESYRTN